MVRNYQRKKPPLDTEKLTQAINLLQSEKVSVRRVAKTFGLNYSTLTRYLRAIQSYDPHGTLHAITPSDLPTICSKKTRTVFSVAQEESLVEYLNQNTDPHFGLTSRDVKVLAYQFAKSLKIIVPGWEVNGMAGKEWLKSFHTRNPSLIIRKQEGHGDCHRTVINKKNIARFIDEMRGVKEESSISCTICDETFENLDDLTQHIELHEDSVLFECAHCFKKFPNKFALSSHIRHHRKLLNDEKRSDDELFSCPTCGDIIRGKYHFHDHQAVHMIEKPFVCDICQMRFQNKVALTGHTKRLHTWEGQKFKCPKCGFIFKYLGNLRKHTMKHQQLTTKKIQKKTYVKRLKREDAPIYPVDPTLIKTEEEEEDDLNFESEIDLSATVKVEEDPFWGIKQEVDE
ncbi:zinc finger protein 333-like [Lutzomyia longipalpis]|uniref:zinc finger protein 333-like n=1 Tax=Lutzomyia longipalpis TaxID=7200 RepID=UPI0024838B44|nr:zinc finger protein 333-like [Lutzomyia longipalpis]